MNRTMTLTCPVSVINGNGVTAYAAERWLDV